MCYCASSAMLAELGGFGRDVVFDINQSYLTLKK